jgi:ketosteroid isomerase-like protein
MRTLVVASIAFCFAAGSRAEQPPAATSAPSAATTLAATVRAREAAFAKTMANRDHAAFTSFVSEEAVFVGRTARRGRKAVADGWKPFFEGPKPPFAWAPEIVEVIDSGTLALSSGPVFDADGKRSGTFHSTWRLEPDGVWRIVLDIGCPPCECR